MNYKGHKIYKISAGRVDCKLISFSNTPDIWWSPRWEGLNGEGSRGGCNSYVLVESESERPRLACGNGAGEVRWWVTENNLSYAKKHESEPWWKRHGTAAEDLAAARYFELEEK